MVCTQVSTWPAGKAVIYGQMLKAQSTYLVTEPVWVFIYESRLKERHADCSWNVTTVFIFINSYLFLVILTWTTGSVKPSLKHIKRHSSEQSQPIWYLDIQTQFSHGHYCWGFWEDPTSDYVSQLWCTTSRRRRGRSNKMWCDIFVNCNWVHTRWQ